MFAEGWVVYPRPRGSPEPTWHSALRASCQVGSGEPLVLGYTYQPSANILIFKNSWEKYELQILNWTGTTKCRSISLHRRTLCVFRKKLVAHLPNILMSIRELGSLLYHKRCSIVSCRETSRRTVSRRLIALLLCHLTPRVVLPG